MGDCGAWMSALPERPWWEANEHLCEGEYHVLTLTFDLASAMICWRTVKHQS